MPGLGRFLLVTGSNLLDHMSLCLLQVKRVGLPNCNVVPEHDEWQLEPSSPILVFLTEEASHAVLVRDP